jgi:hypothetical protein
MSHAKGTPDAPTQEGYQYPARPRVRREERGFTILKRKLGPSKVIGRRYMRRIRNLRPVSFILRCDTKAGNYRSGSLTLSG